MSKRRETFNRVKRATVAIVALTEPGAPTPFKIVGSGFCIDRDGVILTCRHVVECFMSKTIAQQIAETPEAEKGKEAQKLGPFELLTPFAMFYDTRSVASESRLAVLPCQFERVMIKTDFDVAMIKVVRNQAFARGFPFLEIEEYEDISEGDEVVTCGFPLGDHLHQTLGTATSSFTTGIISSVIPAAGVARQYLRGFQLDITVAGGNSGGPVFSLGSGKVIGVLSAGVGGTPVHSIARAEPVYAVVSPENVAEIKKSPQDFVKFE